MTSKQNVGLTGHWNCSKCGKLTPLNRLTNYPAKLVVSYGRVCTGRKEITDASVENPTGLCSMCLQKVAVQDKYHEEGGVAGMDVFLVPSERFGVFFSKYGDWCRKYNIELDTVTGYFNCTKSGSGATTRYVKCRELNVDVNFFKNDDYYKCDGDGSYQGLKNVSYSSKKHRHHPTSNNKNKNKNISNENMPEPSASPSPKQIPKVKKKSLTLPQLNDTSDIKDADGDAEFSELLKEFQSDVSSSFEQDKRLKKKKKKQNYGRYCYTEVHRILDGMAKRAAVGSVRDVKVFIFDNKDFEEYMTVEFENRGTGAWHSCWINLRDKKHCLLKETQQILKVDSVSGDKKFIEVPTMDVLKLWQHVLKVKKLIDDSKNKKWLYGNTLQSVLSHTEQTRHNGGIISADFNKENMDFGNSNNSSNTNTKNPIFASHSKHQTKTDLKNEKKDRWFRHSEDKFVWTRNNADQVNQNAKDFTVALNQIGQSDEDKKTLTAIGTWLIKLPDTTKFINKYTGFDMTDIVKQNSSKYIWLWDIANQLGLRDKRALDRKRIELFEKELNKKK